MEPLRLTRALVIGVAFRIWKTYGYSALGVIMICRWHRKIGERAFLEMKFPEAVLMRPFDNILGENCVLSNKRIQRIRRKLEQVRLRGATYRERTMFRKQAA